MTLIDKKVALYIQEQIGKYIVPIIIASDSYRNGGEYINAGTGTLLDTGQAKFCVTNDHIISEYEESLKKHPNAIFEVCHHEIPIKERIIDRVERPDLATFMIEDNLTGHNKQGKITENEHLECDPWPPSRVKGGEFAIFAGFLAEFMEETNTGQYGLKTVIGGEPIEENPADDHFAVVFQRKYAIKTAGDKEIDDLTRWGGVSGGLVVCAKSSIIITSPIPVGILYEAHPYEILYAHHLDLINGDGTLNKP